MNSNPRFRRHPGAAILSSLILLGSFAAPAGAERLELSLGSGSTLVLEGDSNVHHWSSTASEIHVKASFDAPVGITAPQALRAGAPLALVVRIPVNGMKSGKKKLDDNMKSALEQKEHPDIVFTLDRYERTEQPSTPGVYAVKAFGKLKIAGTERPLKLEVTAGTADRELRVKGDADLLMTDFGVKPPTMMLGTMRTKNEIKVRFNLVLDASAGNVSLEAPHK